MFTLKDLAMENDESTYQKAFLLYKANSIKGYKEDDYSISAKVQGTKTYETHIKKTDYEKGNCTCYMGQNNYICKHMLALAIYHILKHDPNQKIEETIINTEEAINVVHQIRELSEEDKLLWKDSIKKAFTYIKGYTGTSKTWFAYQNKLDAGARTIRHAASILPLCHQSAILLISLALRLDKKLSTGGIDDSNGTIGISIEYIVETLINFTWEDKTISKEFKKLNDQNTCFDWEEPLLRIYKDECGNIPPL